MEAIKATKLEDSINLNGKVFKLIGFIGVDAGLCWVGDPCYIMHQEKLPKAIGKTWHEFVDTLHDEDEAWQYKSYNYDGGHEGLGVCVSTGWGDGAYPVYAHFGAEDRIMGVFVDFGCFDMEDAEFDSEPW